MLNPLQVPLRFFAADEATVPPEANAPAQLVNCPAQALGENGPAVRLTWPISTSGPPALTTVPAAAPRWNWARLCIHQAVSALAVATEKLREAPKEPKRGPSAATRARALHHQVDPLASAGTVIPTACPEGKGSIDEPVVRSTKP